MDSREASKHPHLVELLRSKGSTVETKHLDTGDFIIFGEEDNYVCERKTPSDFMLSLRSAEGWEQVRALAEARDQGFKPLFIWEQAVMWDTLLKRPVSWATYLSRHPGQEDNWNSLFFGLAKWGIPLVPTKDAGGTASLLFYIDRSIGSAKERKKDYPLRSGFRKDMTVEDKRLYLMDAFGHETAKALLAGGVYSVRDLILKVDSCDWYAEDADSRGTTVDKIAGIKLASGRRIGSKKAEEIYDVLFNAERKEEAA